MRRRATSGAADWWPHRGPRQRGTRDGRERHQKKGRVFVSKFDAHKTRSGFSTRRAAGCGFPSSVFGKAHTHNHTHQTTRMPAPRRPPAVPASIWDEAALTSALEGAGVKAGVHVQKIYRLVGVKWGGEWGERVRGGRTRCAGRRLNQPPLPTATCCATRTPTPPTRPACPWPLRPWCASTLCAARPPLPLPPPRLAAPPSCCSAWPTALKWRPSSCSTTPARRWGGKPVAEGAASAARCVCHHKQGAPWPALSAQRGP